ncbi:hypothetical protein [Stieleria tagensis]|uniref:hypothetical protein n=1 Tax=Stieleria tagensis TaxID=2956795 RepID=UPI00209AB2B1|nr:hypothetical protein [Stieleria tagensis]
MKQPSKRQIGEFVDRLTQVISHAAQIHFGSVPAEDLTDEYDKPTDATPRQLAVLGNGCAVCRGHCCSQGKGHAFISVDTILKYLNANPTARPRDVLQAYVSRIGSRTYADSCVYHSQNGCELPREMRSKVCNGYLCKGLYSVLSQLQENESSTAFVVATDQNHVLRAGVIDPAGHQLYDCAELSSDDQTTSNQAEA